ncbi:hypothetical protein TVAG_382840 [Trichomonas vaginalis G3]|uniref:Uncharacterized protein n=1 Tax=Trichomonas vaginalis (strain ATCC PRA-98 / G3) TaxID=412133 RepID=A2FJL2_TRIV3|nr:Ankyrin repeat family [Trichomonas vaginalis G3]EAX94899.1 hypothetical protein TVAG_382840 [Trichomonas vaginalis G3]KAI5482409.1 Ankyrin repeat family [Trichomonas vaginalis G3]|eukprot:XP_001307829.1 hypothetical protein [Trichomonas vaginalis G3]
MTEYLISHGANINQKTNDGETALYFSTVKNNKEITEYLILHGTNIDEM